MKLFLEVGRGGVLAGMVDFTAWGLVDFHWMDTLCR